MRAKFQVLVIPFSRMPAGTWEFAALRRSDAGFWQFVAGGGEDREKPIEAARREAQEEIGASDSAPLFRLESSATIPVTAFPGDADGWMAEGTLVIPEHAFAMDVTGIPIRVSAEHGECRWGSEADISVLLRFDSNRNALWELSRRLERDGLTPA